MTSQRAADHIVNAPNQYGTLRQNRQMLSLWTRFETNLVPPRIALPIRKAEIPVGPPAAIIKILELLPQDYHVTVSTEVTPLRGGKKMMTMKIVSGTNVVSRVTPSDPPATIILLHGYLMTKESMVPWGFQLAQAGYRVILVDLRGHGESTGDTVSYGRDEATDLRQVLDYLVAHGQCDASVGVLGFSYGATLALHWAARDPRVRTVVAMAPYNQPDAAFERLARELRIPITRRSAQRAVALAADRLQLDWADWSGEAAIRRVRAPVLLIGGGKDNISRPQDITRLQTAAAGDTEVIQISAANHFALAVWFHELSAPIEAWFQSHLTTYWKPAESRQ